MAGHHRQLFIFAGVGLVLFLGMVVGCLPMDLFPGSSGSGGVFKESAAGSESGKSTETEADLGNTAEGMIEYLNRTGEPQIPWKVLTFLLPPDVDFSRVSAELVGGQFSEIEATGRIAATPPAAFRLDDEVQAVWPEDKTLVNGEDTAIYGSDSFWPQPQARVLDTGRLRKWRLARVAVPLIQYNPVQGRRIRLTGGKVAVQFERHPAAAKQIATVGEMEDSIGEKTVRETAVNFEQVAAEYSGEPGVVVPEYVIVTTAAIRAASTQLANFVDHKAFRGFTVRVITESDFGGGTGNKAAENIRGWLKAHYLSEHIQYVLLVGNPHPVSGTVPMKKLWPRYGAGDGYEDAPSDFYYADLTGNWDKDGDGYAGEWTGDFGSGGVDRNPEVLVGRIPYYGSMADTDAILQKIVAYQLQAGAAAAWRKNALLAMKPSDSSTPGYPLGEEIKADFLDPAGWDSTRVYDKTYSLSPVPEFIPCSYTTVTEAWRAGSFGLVAWWTHGNATVAADVMDTAHVGSLSNAYPALVFQNSCLNASPETATNLSYSLLQQGAIGAIGATRVSWYYQGETGFGGSASSSGVAYEFCRRVIGGGMTVGEALYDLKKRLSPTDRELWMNFAVFNLYGDPEIGLVSQGDPPVVAVQTQSQSALVGSSVTFSVTASGTGPFRYQWQRQDDSNGWVDIGNETNAAFTIPSVSGADAGSYRCIVTNRYGSTGSTTATLNGGDANRDGVVDVSDLGILAAHYGGQENNWGAGDFNGDGSTEVSDLGILAANYGFGVLAP